MSTANTWALWQPPIEKVEALATQLRSHWRCGHSQPVGLFWPKPADWLRRQAERLAEFTTGPGAADS